jgi:hypothetical protein
MGRDSVDEVVALIRLVQHTRVKWRSRIRTLPSGSVPRLRVH